MSNDTTGRAALDAALLLAHETGDAEALVTLYKAAADQASDPVAQSFYLTHAYVFALETGDPRAADCYQQLRAGGFEE